MRLSIARRIKHALATLKRHVRHAEDLVAEVLETVRGVHVVALAVEAVFEIRGGRGVQGGRHELVVGVDGVVELGGVSGEVKGIWNGWRV